MGGCDFCRVGGGLMAELMVVEPGPMALVQDRGRPGLARYGVTTSGALDRAALRLANRLVGNPESAAGLELLLGGARLQGTEPMVVAVTGPPVQVRVQDARGAIRTVSSHHPVVLPCGARLLVGTPERGLRCYLAVRGGIAVEPVFGSVASDPTAGIGPAPLGAGQVLPIGPDPGLPVPGLGLELTAALAGGPAPGQVVRVRARRGPRADWLSPAALTRLGSAVWSVGSASNRVGIRLEGQLLERSPDRVGELPSEPVVRGAIQVSTVGEPVIFLADHPTTGGYPVVAVVDDDDQDLLAQVRPGDRIRVELWG